MPRKMPRWPRLLCAALLAAGAAAPAMAQADGERSGEASFWGRLSAAYWCEIVVGDDADLGCDVGVGVALARWPRRGGDFVLAGAIGRSSVVLGPAWSFGEGGGPRFAVGIGVMVPYDGNGLRAEDAAPAVGANFRFGGGDDD